MGLTLRLAQGQSVEMCHASIFVPCSCVYACIETERKVQNKKLNCTEHAASKRKGPDLAKPC